MYSMPNDIINKKKKRYISPLILVNKYKLFILKYGLRKIFILFCFSHGKSNYLCAKYIPTSQIQASQLS